VFNIDPYYPAEPPDPRTLEFLLDPRRVRAYLGRLSQLGPNEPDFQKWLKLLRFLDKAYTQQSNLRECDRLIERVRNSLEILSYRTAPMATVAERWSLPNPRPKG
jgi:hypothetical protein